MRFTQPQNDNLNQNRTTALGIEALTTKDDGTTVQIPQSAEDWQKWISAGRTRNWMLDDPLIDWLQQYGEDRDYLPKSELSGYNRDLDFTQFIFQKGREFEEGILRLFHKQHEVVTIAENHYQIRDFEKAKETFETMRDGAPIIYQAVLWDAENLNYGSPDFLIRSDTLQNLFPDSSFPTGPAPDLNSSSWHYIVVDTKFTTLQFNAAATELTNSGSTKAYKAQLFIYNRMLGRLQGLQPPESYLLGRGWQYTNRGETYRCPNALSRLGPVHQQETLARGVPIAEEVENALDWIRRVRTEGKDWEILPVPSLPELYPNMSNLDDAGLVVDDTQAELEPNSEDELSAHKWVGVKKWLATELNELTQLWYVGIKNRQKAHDYGLFRWNDTGVNSQTLGIGGGTIAPILDKLLEVNLSDGPPVLPNRITDTRDTWHATPRLEFYVDFEFCSDLNDDFSKLPEKGGQPLIFMIGCGHLENDQWQFKSFVTNGLTQPEELRIINQWFDHMTDVRSRIDPTNSEPRIFHWSHAEVTALQNAYNSAKNRHKDNAEWPELGWFDFLQQVMRKEPVVVRGALNFGLKPIANAMHSHKLIQTHWADSPIDGLGAMVGAWRCDEQARNQNIPIHELPLMQEIIEYNEIDCKVMMEIIRYLRKNH